MWYLATGLWAQYFVLELHTAAYLAGWVEVDRREGGRRWRGGRGLGRDPAGLPSNGDRTRVWVGNPGSEPTV